MKKGYYVIILTFAPHVTGFGLRNIITKLRTLSFNCRWQDVKTRTDLAKRSHTTVILGPTALLRTPGFPTSQSLWPIGSSTDLGTYSIPQWPSIHFEEYGIFESSPSAVIQLSHTATMAMKQTNKINKSVMSCI